MLVKRLLVGLPLKTAQAAHERLSKRLALAIFCPNPLSSVAYATEEILLILILAGTMALWWSIPLSLGIVGLILILNVSYRQIIYEYPEGGGAYVVAKNNIGELPGLTAAAALMIDYTLTVAVSTAAGIAAITSAWPTLFPYRVGLGLAAIILVVPIIIPLINQVGIDPVHFGLVLTINLAIGQQTPPVASVLITACSIARANIWQVTKVNVYFVAVLLVVLFLCTYVPIVPMFLVDYFYRS